LRCTLAEKKRNPLKVGARRFESGRRGRLKLLHCPGPIVELVRRRERRRADAVDFAWDPGITDPIGRWQRLKPHGREYEISPSGHRCYSSAILKQSWDRRRSQS